MKQLILAAIFSFAAINAFSQECKGFIPTTVNTVVEYNHLNPKGKIESTSKTIYKEVKQLADALSIKTDNFGYDDKGKETYKSEMEYFCKNGVISFSMNSMIDPATMSQYKDMEVKMESDKMEIPSTLTAGQALNNGTCTMTISNQGVKMMTMTVVVTNRKVEAVENITVPAGTYECYKITYDVESKMMFKVQTKAVEWYCTNVGLVKSESYDKNGKLTGSSELKSLSK
jgi:hypothetical protein